MQILGKSKLTLLIMPCLFLLAKSSLAQYPVVGSTLISTNQQINTKAGLQAADHLYNNKYAFEITLKDRSTRYVDSKIFVDSLLHQNYLLWVDKNYPNSDTAHRYQKIYPKNTTSILRKTFTLDTIKGFANDSCWMFKVISGPICVYSFLSEMDSGPFFDPMSIVGIQFKGGPILKYTEYNLKQMIGSDKYALESIRQKNYIRAIKRFNWEKKKKPGGF